VPASTSLPHATPVATPTPTPCLNYSVFSTSTTSKPHSLAFGSVFGLCPSSNTAMSCQLHAFPNAAFSEKSAEDWGTGWMGESGMTSRGTSGSRQLIRGPPFVPGDKAKIGIGGEIAGWLWFIPWSNGILWLSRVWQFDEIVSDLVGWYGKIAESLGESFRWNSAECNWIIASDLYNNLTDLHDSQINSLPKI